ncbi:MAG: DUF4071 domain-containing protein [Bacteroidetes bacterium]|nr:DUF4071 domain-containing protein [Bacteroidota bacterium]
MNPTEITRDQITTLIEEGRFFAAFEASRAAIELYPDSISFKQLMARTLILTGAVDQARLILEPIQSEIDCENKRQGEESAGLLGRAFKDLWHRTGDSSWATKSQESYSLGYELTKGLWPGINAATMLLLTGKINEARKLATELIMISENQIGKNDEDFLYWNYATMGEAYLVLNEPKKAIEAYRNAAANADITSRVVSTRRQLLLLREKGIGVPDLLFDILTPATVILFTGHMIDHPKRKVARFPSGLEKKIKTEINRFLDSFDSAIGYSSAACGADILFAEAMLAKGWEVNIMLPFAVEDFIQTSVEYAGLNWVKRFRRVIDKASSVKMLTEEAYNDDEILFNFAGKLFHGFASLRAENLGIEPHLLAVWDGVETTFIGGTSDIVTNWSDRDRVHIIRTDDLLRQSEYSNISPDTSVQKSSQLKNALTAKENITYHRIIKTLLFADIVGYSKIKEQDTPRYIFQFLRKIAKDLDVLEEKPTFLNTWGDAIFTVMDSAVSLAKYAITLNNSISNINWVAVGFPADMNIRIALHAGPVFEGQDPLSGRTNYYGAHVNRAARIEPVAAPGLVYVSEQFAALLTIEQKETKEFICDYVGVTELAKEFGSQVIYSLRKK